MKIFQKLIKKDKWPVYFFQTVLLHFINDTAHVLHWNSVFEWYNKFQIVIKCEICIKIKGACVAECVRDVRCRTYEEFLQYWRETWRIPPHRPVGRKVRSNSLEKREFLMSQLWKAYCDILRLLHDFRSSDLASGWRADWLLDRTGPCKKFWSKIHSWRKKSHFFSQNPMKWNENQ